MSESPAPQVAGSRVAADSESAIEDRDAGIQRLERGALRNELLGREVSAATPVQGDGWGHEARLGFDGRGAEYFRIWVVHTFLTLLTLGLYSPWAKVRKMQWFARHTVLLDDRFNYHGEPWRILIGRVLALALLALWTWSFDLSVTLGFAVLALFCIVGPILFAGAQRFKLANTSWRGLRFGFEVPRREVYAVCVPLLLIWTSGTILGALDAPLKWLMAGTLLPLLALPLAHARLKAVQHGHARFGQHRFRFESAAVAFYEVYALALVLLIVAGVIGGLLAVFWAASQRPAGAASSAPSVHAWLGVAAAALLIWMLTWPCFAARQQQVVWSRTQLGDLRFRGEMGAAALTKKVLGQSLLVLATAGLYWPFAAVAIARYRVQSLVVWSPEPFGSVRHEGTGAVAAGGSARAAGDGAADAFGLDLGW